MQIERKLLPATLHHETKDQTADKRNDPGKRAHKAGRRQLEWLVVQHDGSSLDGVRSEGAFEQPEGGAQDQNCKQNEADEKTNLEPEHVPVDCRVAQRTEPERGNIDGQTARGGD